MDTARIFASGIRNAGGALHAVGLGCAGPGDANQAAEALGKAVAIRRKVLTPGHPDLAWSLSSWGFALSRAGDLSAARKAAEDSVAVRRATVPPDELRLAWGLSGLGLGRYTASRTARSQLSSDRQVSML